MKEFRDAVIFGDKYTNKDGEEKSTSYKIGRLMIDGEKMVLFSPLFPKPINFFKREERDNEKINDSDIDFE